jgi:hypothetical protein
MSTDRKNAVIVGMLFIIVAVTAMLACREILR